jgi:tripartite-type tricarboxylate transporter receptor subunit TctC
MVSSGVPSRNVKEFISYLKSNPGKLNYATAGNGSATHLSMAYFCGLAGVEMVHIPFKATGEAVNEVLAGRAHAVIAANIGALPYVNDSRARMLGATGAARSKFLPDLPAVAESLPGYQFDSWIALLAPAQTPRAFVEQVNAAVAGLLKDPVILGRLDKQGVVPQAMTPAALDALLKDDFQKMAKVVKASGARID